MTFKKTILAVAACLLLVASLAIFTGGALAADKGGASADQKVATQQGLPTKEFDTNKMPGKMEIGLTIGSVVAVIAAFKYL